MPRTLRLVIAVGDPAVEAALQEALEARGHRTRRCLSIPDLLGSLQSERCDSAIVGSTLYQLTAERWRELLGTGIPLVLRASPADQSRLPGASVVFAPDTAVSTLEQALVDAATSRPAQAASAAGAGPRVEEVAAGTTPVQSAPGGRVLAISGAAGSGRTTVAANLALALGLAARTVAVDADLSVPALGPALDGDVTRNLVALAQAGPGHPPEWERALAREGQPLHRRCPLSVLLCGLPRPEQRGAIGSAFCDRLLAELRQRFAYVVLDTGADVVGPDSGLQRAALLAADDILLVSRADPLGVWGARTILGLWERQLGVPEERLALVVNGYDRRQHPAPAAIAWHLRLPVAEVLPEDRAALHRAQLARQPVLFCGGRFADALIALADRIHGGHIRWSADPQRGNRWWRWPIRLARQRARQEHARDSDAVPAN